MIIVTGATGQLGHAIVEALARRMPAGGIVASVRDPAKAADLAALGVDIRHGDFAQPTSLATAFKGATQLLLVSSNAAATGGDPLAQHRAAIDAARAVGIRRIIYTSHMAASPISAFPPMLDHVATEEMLAASGLAWTALRNGFYATSGLTLMGNFAQTAQIEAPADGKVAWTAHADLAEAAAAILADEGRFDGPTPPLTGSTALDLADLAAIASDLLGRPVTRALITDADLEARMAGHGVPPARAGIALGLYRAARAGEFSRLDPTLEQLIGRPAIGMRDVIAATLPV